MSAAGPRARTIAILPVLTAAGMGWRVSENYEVQARAKPLGFPAGSPVLGEVREKPGSF